MKCVTRSKKEDDDRIPISAALIKFCRMLVPKKKSGKKSRSVEEEDEDRLSQLPNCVAVYVLSFLPIKDAARTSALSRYWRRRWLFTGAFDFDTALAFKRGNRKSKQLLDRHDSRRAEWVSSVLRSHSEASDDEGNPLLLHKLRICMYHSLWCQNELDEWFSYAFARQVQSLELNLTYYSSPVLVRFPNGIDFNCLRSLSLDHVNVRKEVISSFLCRFAFLERLKVCGSAGLQSLTVCGSSLALKHLEISYCPFLCHLIVRDTSLVSLTVTWMTCLSLSDNPKLVAVHAAEWRHRNCAGMLRQISARLPMSENIFGQLYGCLTRVQILTFDTAYSDLLEDIDKVPELTEVKQLTLIVDPLQKDSLIRLTTLLSLSPKLEKLVLEFLFLPKNCKKKTLSSSEMQTKLIRSPRFPVQQHIKVVEVRGYYGEVAEDEALMLVLQHVAALPERVIFNSRNLRPDTYPPYGNPRSGVKKKRTKLLKRVLPPSVEFIVI